MNIALVTHQQFLQERLGFLRARLLGLSVKETQTTIQDRVVVSPVASFSPEEVMLKPEAIYTPNQVNIPAITPPKITAAAVERSSVAHPISQIILPVVSKTPKVSQPVSLPKLGLTPTQPLQSSTQVGWKNLASSMGKQAIRIILWVVISTGIVASLALFTPKLYYLVFPVETSIVQVAEQGTPQGGAFEAPLATETPGRQYQPPVDSNLPEGNWIVIPRIGVRTQLQKTQNPDEALATGVWHVPDLGDPGDTEKPMIVAAHRFGWNWWWKDDYWKYHSFYLLPETEPGDRIEIIADQRKWIYEIYAGEEGEEITDYSGDLILYTCKFLNSPVRHFRYAKLIDPTANTQAGI